jgi:hypothetical protein
VLNDGNHLHTINILISSIPLPNREIHSTHNPDLMDRPHGMVVTKRMLSMGNSPTLHGKPLRVGVLRTTSQKRRARHLRVCRSQK